MKKIRVIAMFNDKQHENKLRNIGDEFTEENERADDLIARRYATLIEEVKEVAVEKAVKEVKKEKAIIEKAVKVIKKNAKK